LNGSSSCRNEQREEGVVWNPTVDEVAEEAVELLALCLKTRGKHDADVGKEDTDSAIGSTEHETESREDES
jgi:hypothetical protein